MAACQRFLIDAAAHLAPDQLRVVGKKLWQVIDPDGADRKEGEALEDEEELAKAKAYFRSWRNGDGTTSFRGKLPDLHADILIRAIQALAAPARRKNPTIATHQPDDIHHPAHPAPAPAPAEESAPADEQPADQQTVDDQPVDEPAGDDHGGDRRGGSQDDPTGEPEPPPEQPEVPYPVRLGHALIELLERCPIDQIDHSTGNNATIVVSMTLDQLTTGLGVATLDDGTEISAAQARRLACGAGLIPLVLDGDSQPLDLGTTQRFHTPYQRTVIKAIDKHCAIHDCARPAAQCHIHHPLPHAAGGPTSITNGAPLCPYHHGLAHHSGWTITWHGRTATLTKNNKQP